MGGGNGSSCPLQSFARATAIGLRRWTPELQAREMPIAKLAFCGAREMVLLSHIPCPDPSVRNAAAPVDAEAMAALSGLALAEHRMLGQDLGTDQEQSDAARRLREPPKSAAQAASKKNTHRCHRERRHTDCERVDDYVGVEQSERHADCHCVNARADRGDHQNAERALSRLFLAVRPPHAVADHLRAHRCEQAKRNPVVERRDIAGGYLPSSPTNHGRNRLGGAEYHAFAEGFTETRALQQGTFAKSGGKRIR